MRQAIWQGILRIGKFELVVAVLDDGTRIIENESLRRFFEAMEHGVVIEAGEELKPLLAFCSGGGIPPDLGDTMSTLTDAVKRLKSAIENAKGRDKSDTAWNNVTTAIADVEAAADEEQEEE